MTTLPGWLPFTIAACLTSAVVFAVVGVVGAVAGRVWPEERREGGCAPACGPETPSRDSRDADTAHEPSQRRTAPHDDRSTR